jgi:phospholipid/cholesterol/gamma-HCH transport system substrate-binding protein
MTRVLRVLALTLVVALSAGCGFKGVYSLPLPGAAGTGPHTYGVKVQLADVLDLVPYSAVKVNGATVGHVSTISVQGHHALVTCRLPDSVHLPANSVARIEQTSVLGEKFVELEPPPTGAQGRLADGDTVPLARTATDATVEEVLGALSMLLNGGGVGQLHTITHELAAALHGRTGAARDLLDNLRVFVAGLNQQRGAIIRALGGLDSLTRTVRQQESTLVHAIDTIPGAVRILADDRRRLTGMLVSVQRLGDVATHVVNASHADLVSNLRRLQPTLDKLAQVGTVIPQTLGVIATYPTADSVEQEYFGDYGNLSLTLDTSTASLLHTFGPTTKATAAGHTRRGARAGHRKPRTGHRLPRKVRKLLKKVPGGSPLPHLLLGALS